MDAITLFLCGDVMTGRGIDQILASPCDPALHEGYLESAEAGSLTRSSALSSSSMHDFVRKLNFVD